LEEYLKSNWVTIKQILSKNLINLPGWHTNRKIVVIESDDWGSIRMPSKDVYTYLLKNGYKVDERPYERYDSLESNQDMEALFDVLISVKDKNNHPAVFTANSVVANPDFAKIRQSNYQTYYYELFYKTLEKYPDHSKVFDFYQSGIENNIFIPQFHGREHFNIPHWIRDLQNGNNDVRFVFDLGMAGIFPKKNPHQGNQYLVAYAISSEIEKDIHKKTIEEGLNLFEKIWKYKSKTFIAPCYTWDRSYESVLFHNKVQLIQSSIFQFEPQINKGKKKIVHYSGEKNSYNQIYNVRNCAFEPTSIPNIDWVDSCLAQINIAFKWHKPAIICSHRINYMGNIDESNRTGNLILLRKLLKNILLRWPDVEFCSSDKLMDLMI
jgi:hypothetical protein